MNLTEDKKKLFLNIALTLCYAIFTFFIVLHHELWTDEVQVWLLVKNLSLFDLLKQLVHEGHPSLFYLLVMPFAKLNLGIVSMQIICWLFSTAAIFLLLQFSPFGIFVKLSVILSAGFLYAFPVMARNYSIIPFLVFLCAILYTKRKENPILYAVILALISQTHYIMLGFSSILFLFFLYEQLKEKNFSKQTKIAYIIMFFSIFLTCFSAFMSTNSNAYIKFSTGDSLLSVLAIFIKFIATALNSVHLIFIPPLFLLFSVVALIFFIQLFLVSRKSFLIVFCAIGFQILVYYFYYPNIMYITRVFCGYLILIFGFWICYTDTTKSSLINKAKITFSLLFLFTFINGIALSFLDINNLYSSSKSTADYIKKNIGKDEILLTDASPMAETITVYLPDGYKIYNVKEDRELKFSLWNETTIMRFEKNDWDEYIKKHNYIGKKLYIIQDSGYMVNLGKILYFAPKTIRQNEQFVVQEYTFNE